MMNSLLRATRDAGQIPLSWAGSTKEMDYLNFGDALSPVMVALLSGLDIERIPTKSRSVRMGAVGTIGHGFEGGEVWFWGTGCSNWKNPSAPMNERARFTVPPESLFHVPATRGPVSARLLGGRTSGGVYGDPVWLLPRFYKPKIEKKWDLGVILHLSELADRALEAHPRPEYKRFQIPAEFEGRVHLISTVTPIGIGGLQDKMDEILACRRIVSTSLHGMVIAESYGIPCLYFSPAGTEPGLTITELDPDGPTDLRIVDLYTGIGKEKIWSYGQPRALETDWQDVLETIDDVWEPVGIDEDALINAFPLDVKPVAAAAGGTVWDHPVLQKLVLQHSVDELRKADRKRVALARVGDAKAEAPALSPKPAPTLKVVPAMSVPSTPSPAKPPTPVAPPSPAPMASSAQAAVALAPAPAPDRVAAPAVRRLEPASRDRLETMLRFNEKRLSVPLSWVATTSEHPHANLGDALSAVVVSAIAGLPVRRAAFDDASERMVAVGTIGHAQKNGVLHFWGTGMDATLNPVDRSIRQYIRPQNTDFVVHGVRGRKTAEVLRGQGIKVPDVFGDPVWFLPRIMPMGHVKKTHDLGVILHISELTSMDPESGVKEALKRYNIPPSLAGSIRLINTYTAPKVDAFAAKVEEIVSCRRIISTSLHGMVIAETYGVPCGWFGTYEGGRLILDVDDAENRIDHRIRDFYAGVGKPGVIAFCRDRSLETPWEDVITWIDETWQPLRYDGRALFDAFPVAQSVSFDDAHWPVSGDVYARIPF
ncbi:polysaccharide pyruvyl transferase family protein [Inquilinus sp. 2KB_12]